MRVVYKSKVDVWLLALVYGLSVLSAMPALYVGFSWIALIVLLFIVSFITLLVFGIKYVIEGELLYIHYSCFHVETVNINKITRISATRNPISAPAASIDRICIEYDNGTVVISPKDKETFIRQLCEMCERDIVVQI